MTSAGLLMPSDLTTQEIKMKKNRKNTGLVSLKIRENIGKVFSCGSFVSEEAAVQSEYGTQLSLEGELTVKATSFVPDCDLLNKTILSLGYTNKIRDNHRVFYVMCGDTEKYVSLGGAVNELLELGAEKIIIATDTVEARDNVSYSFETLQSGKKAGLTVYNTEDILENEETPEDIAYSFASSPAKELLIINSASFCRKNNLINQKNNGLSPADIISHSSPVVLIDTSTVDSAKVLLKKASLFNPSSVVIFSTEVKRIRSNIIYMPDTYIKVSSNKKTEKKESLQLEL